MNKLKVKKLDPRAILPTRAAYGDLGYDLYALEDTLIPREEVTLVRTGIACNFPDGIGGILKDRSSVATKLSMTVRAGVIDQGYTGEIKVALYRDPIFFEFTHSQSYRERESAPYLIKAGDKIAQMVLVPVMGLQVEETDGLDETERGDKGFGSSGQ